MTINLNVSIDLSTTEDRAVVERALCTWAQDVLSAEPQLQSLGDPDYVLAIIEDVKVRVG